MTYKDFCFLIDVAVHGWEEAVLWWPALYNDYVTE